MVRLAHMETLVQTQQATIAALTTVAQQHQSASVEGNILESRSFTKLKRFDGSKDAWRDWAFVVMSYIQTASPVLENGMEHAGKCQKTKNLVKDSKRLPCMLTACSRSFWHAHLWTLCSKQAIVKTWRRRDV